MRLKSIAGLVLATLVALLTAELFLRGTEISLPPKSAIDEEFGKRLSPGSRFCNFNEGYCMAEVNEYGYLGPAYPAARATGVPRIALMGDSYVQGAYLFPRYHFRSVLEEDLEARTGRAVEVLNFGLTAIDLRKMFIYYEQFAARFAPDLVLFFVSEGDLSLRDPRVLGPDLRLDGGELAIDNGFRERREFRLRAALGQGRRSSLLGLLHRAYQWYKEGDPARILFGKLALAGPERQAAPVADAGGTAASRGTEDGEGTEDALWHVNRAIVQRLVRLERERATRFVIVCKAPVSERYRQLFAAHGFEVLDVAASLEALEQDGIDPIYWRATGKRGHWNHHAQRAVGLYLGGALAPQVERLAQSP